MKWSCRGLAASAATAAAGIAIGLAVLAGHAGEGDTLGKPLLRRLQKENVVDNSTLRALPAPAWPCRAANPSGTGSVNRTALTDLSQPAWSFYFDALVITTPVMDEVGNLYLAPTSGMVWSLDPNGETRWKHKLLGMGPPTPAIHGDLLIIADSLGYAYGLDLGTGKVRWVREVANQLGLDSWAITVGSGLATLSLSMDDEMRTSQLIGVEAATGEERWTFALTTTMHNVAPAFVDGGAGLVFADGDAGLYKLDAATGRLLWRVPGYNWTVPQGPVMVFRSLAGGVQVQGGLVYSTGNPSFAAGVARAHRVDTGELVWQSRKFKEHMSNSAAVGTIDGVATLICGVGFTPPLHYTLPTARKPFVSTLVALDALTGDVRWTFKSPSWDSDMAAGQPFIKLGLPHVPNSWSAPTIAGDGTVYVTWMGGVLYALDGRNGTLISQYPTGEGAQGHAVVGHRRELVVAGGSHAQLFRECSACGAGTASSR